MADIQHLILVGAQPPVAFFAYPNKPGWLTPDSCQIHTLTNPEDDHLQALEALAETLNVPTNPGPLYTLDRPDLPTGELDPAKVWTALSALMPEQSIICDESITSSRGAEFVTAGAPPHDWLSLTGGAIGIGLPLAVGAAVACPDRKVFATEADGSGMYTLQALWTQAREKLDVVNIIFSNRAYAILQVEQRKVGAGEPGQRIKEMLALDNPTLDWVQLAQGMGVSAGKATTAEEFNRLLETAVRTPGPHLIEAVLA